jgi:hypothetical protein
MDGPVLPEGKDGGIRPYLADLPFVVSISNHERKIRMNQEGIYFKPLFDNSRKSGLLQTGTHN